MHTPIVQATLSSGTQIESSEASFSWKKKYIFTLQSQCMHDQNSHIDHMIQHLQKEL